MNASRGIKAAWGLGASEFPAVGQCGVGCGVGTEEGGSVPGKEMDCHVGGEVVVGIGQSGVDVHILLPLEATLKAHPDGILVGVDDAIDNRHFAPGGVRVKLGLAGGEQQQDRNDREKALHAEQGLEFVDS